MTSILKNMFVDNLDNIVHQHNKIYHRLIKLNRIDVNSSKYIDCNVENNDKDPWFEIADHVRILNKKTFLKKATLQIGLKTFFPKDKPLVYQIIYIYRWYKCYLILNFVGIFYSSWNAFYSKNRINIFFNISDSHKISFVRVCIITRAN